MSIFKCKMCGGTLEIRENQTTAVCEYCGTTQTLPKLDDDRRVQMYDRANHFRRNNEFDKAMSIYEKILNEDNTDAEAYWSIVLCRYGIEYVEDPATHKRVPTVNRAQFTSIFDDEDYRSALNCADGYQKAIYEEEARTINEIQKGILAISQKEEPFDVFICYKETDNNGRRTQDSVLANDLYHQLTQEGFKVFFSRITLEDKLGTAYEPYIFAALNSARVMIVIGTKPEYFNAVWVKNEWSRYLALIKNGAKKMLIPAYRDMDPYDLPEEFSHLQAQDMSKLGFMQDLIRGIKKLTESDASRTPVEKTVMVNNSSANVRPLLQRAFMFLEDGDWNSANEYCEKVLDLEPENAEAYLGKLMAELYVHTKGDLKNVATPFDGSNNYQKAVRFGDPALSDELKGYIDYIKERNKTAEMEEIYQTAVEKMNAAISQTDYTNAGDSFASIKNYKDAKDKADECYEKAENARKDAVLAEADELSKQNNISSLEKAGALYESISGWKNADELAGSCSQRLEELKIEQQRKAEQKRIAAKKRKRIAKKAAMIGTPIVVLVVALLLVLNSVIIPNRKYNHAVELMNAGDYTDAIEVFAALGDYRDAKKQIVNCNNRRQEYYYIEALNLLENGQIHDAVARYVDSGCYQHSHDIVNAWRSLYADTISAGGWHTVGLKTDGTVVATGNNAAGQCDVEEWTDIVAVAAGSGYIVGVKSDGTVVAAGSNGYGRCNVEEWTDIVAVAAGSDHTVGVKSDGTVVAAGSNGDGQCDVEEWTDIVAVAAGDWHTVGVKSDGTVVAAGDNGDGQCDVEEWTDIAAVAAGDWHTVGLKSDGTVVAAGDNWDGQCDVEEWTDIVAVAAGSWHTVGLKSDGTVVAAGDNWDGQCDVEEWTDIVAVAAGSWHTVGVKSDGTVVAAGENEDGQCDVEEWRNIALPKNEEQIKEMYS